MNVLEQNQKPNRPSGGLNSEESWFSMVSGKPKITPALVLWIYSLCTCLCPYLNQNLQNMLCTRNKSDVRFAK